MKRLVLALLVGLAAGYHWGYDDGNGGKPTVIERTLDRFGTSKIKAAQDESNRRIEEAGKP
jgi:hypothetical protein